MMQQEQLQTQDDDEISLIGIILFLKASGGNIVKSTLVCLLAGGAYYFSVPKMYEASATIHMATVAGEPVESPMALLEKLKLPLYFSPATLQACGSDGGLSSQAKFVDKIKPTINKSTPTVSFVTKSQSTQEAKACLNAAIAEVSRKQDAIANPLVDQRKKQLNQLSEQLKTTEEIVKNLHSNRLNNNLNNNLNNTQSILSLSLVALIKTNIDEINYLRGEISSLEFELIAPKTLPTTLLNSVYSSEDSANKRPLYTLGLCLSLGVFLGLLVTGVMQMASGIREQIRDAESRTR